MRERQILLSRLVSARAATDALFGMVKAEAMYDRPIPERHRIVFYVGHLEAFDWNLLRQFGNQAGGETDLDRLFAFGIDPMGGNLPTDSPRDWPRLEIVGEYRDRLRLELDDMLASAEVPDELMNIAIEHRLMHAETLTYILHQLPYAHKERQTARDVIQDRPFTPGSVRIPPGAVTLGLSRNSSEFGWDNEFEEHSVDVPGFTIDKYKVTNGQFLQFLRDGSYTNRSLWTGPDWEWRAANDISHPVFWARNGDTWSYRSMFDQIPLPRDWPAYVSHAEASAYARWAGKMLPTEAEWQRAAGGSQVNLERQRSLGDTWDPAPVDDCAGRESPFGIRGMFANGWEWTSGEFAPFPGFRPSPSYPGYSAPFFDGKHYVLKGGSVRTAACMLRPSFRNWFQPHYQYVYAGFRCVSHD